MPEAQENDVDSSNGPVARLEMFKTGLFSSNPEQPCQVDSGGLKKLTAKKIARGLQVTADSPIAGLQGRTSLLIRLSEALLNQEIYINFQAGFNLSSPSNTATRNAYFCLFNRSIVKIHDRRRYTCHRR
jgi:hypothetical protein